MCKNEQLDRRISVSGLGKWFKKQKARFERRKAKRQPDTQPTYGKYKGYQ